VRVRKIGLFRGVQLPNPGGVWLNMIGIVLIAIAMHALFIPILAIG
jgi:hypothetical protein